MIGAAICYDWLFPEAIRQLALRRGRSADSRFGLHGSLGNRSADGLVDDGQPSPRLGEHVLRRGRQPGGQPGQLSAFQLAGRQHDRRFRRTPVGPGRSRPGNKIVVGPIDLAALRHERSAVAGTICWPTCEPPNSNHDRSEALVPGQISDRISPTIYTPQFKSGSVFRSPGENTRPNI